MQLSKTSCPSVTSCAVGLFSLYPSSVCGRSLGSLVSVGCVFSVVLLFLYANNAVLELGIALYRYKYGVEKQWGIPADHEYI